jgi:glycosyltransferase involved in cell wall biosynthesis
VRVAIVHDYLTQRGGAERVVLALHRLYPDAPIYTSFYDPATTFPEFTGADIRTSFLQRFPHAGNAFRANLPLFPAAFGRFRFDGYDLVVSSSSGWAHGARTGRAFHVCYCHAPAKWLYRTDDYLGAGGSVPAAARPLLAPVLAALRRWDAAAARRPDLYVANSRHVAEEIKRIYGRDAPIVFPPVSVERFASTALAEEPAEPYFLVVARLLPYKRVDLAIRACVRRGAKLVVVGDGPERDALVSLAGGAVTFVPRADDDELARLYAGATALIQCGKEDFGIAPLEANASGRPVVAFGEGGALDTVVDGQTGILFAEQSVDAVFAALGRCVETVWSQESLRAYATRFGEERFIADLRTTIADAYRAARG